MQLPAIQLTPPELKVDADASNLTEADAEQLQGDLLVRTGAFDDADRHLAASLALDRMSVAARLSQAAAGLTAKEHDRLLALLDALHLSRRMPPVPLRTLLRFMRTDKKRSAAGVRWVLTPQIGHASVPRLLPDRMVRAALRDAGAGR